MKKWYCFLFILLVISCKNNDGLFIDSAEVVHMDSSCERIINICIFVNENSLYANSKYCGSCICKQDKTEMEQRILKRITIEKQSNGIQFLHSAVSEYFDDTPDSISAFIELINNNEKVRNTVYDFLHTKKESVYIRYELRNLFDVKRGDFKNTLLQCEESYKLIHKIDIIKE